MEQRIDMNNVYSMASIIMSTIKSIFYFILFYFFKQQRNNLLKNFIEQWTLKLDIE